MAYWGYMHLRWELAFTLLDKLDREDGLHITALGISIHPS